MNQNKVNAYNELIERVKKCNACQNELEHCPFSNEINLWSYWQGGRENLDAKILLVGQDWGCFSNGKFKVQNEKKVKKQYRYKESKSLTDNLLYELFNSIGYDITGNSENSKRDLHELFFTNFVLCYRKFDNNSKTKSNSGNFKACWRNNCKEFFVELVNIIKPKIILCLGRETYAGVKKAANEKSGNIKKYNDIISKGCKVMTFKDTECTVFPLAHPGSMGTLNRCRANDAKEISSAEGERLQMGDWEKVAKKIEKLESKK